MKKLLLLSALFAVVFFACKDKDEPQTMATQYNGYPGGESRLNGDWIAYSYSLGYMHWIRDYIKDSTSLDYEGRDTLLCRFMNGVFYEFYKDTIYSYNFEINGDTAISIYPISFDQTERIIQMSSDALETSIERKREPDSVFLISTNGYAIYTSYQIQRIYKRR